MINKFTESEKAHCKAICTNDIEAGDKVHLRDGSVVVVRKGLGGELQILYTSIHDNWFENGGWLHNKDHLLDIIRIEKAPKPVVETYWVSFFDGVIHQWKTRYNIEEEATHKITITDGEATIEQVVPQRATSAEPNRRVK